MIAKRLAISLFAGVLPLAAVAAVATVSEPTDQEIMSLTEKDVARANEPIIDYHKRLDKGSVPDDMLIKLNSVKKIDCKPVDGASAHDCNVEMDMTVPQGGRRTRTILIRFTKTEDGWKGSRSP